MNAPRLGAIALLVLMSLCGGTSAAAEANSEKFSNTTRNVWPIEGNVPLQITTVAAWASAVTLTYQVGYNVTDDVPMKAGTDGKTWSAAIPASAMAPGNLVRWAVSSGTVRHPKAASSEGDANWYGLIVPDASDPASLPVMELYCEDDRAPFSTGPQSNNQASVGGKGDVLGCSMSYNGTFYDGLSVRRRGSSSLSWTKPKIRVKASTQDFSIPGIAYDIDSFGLNSNWFEPGENTFTREPLVWDVLGRMGVPSVSSFQLHLRFRGAYFGRYSFVEDWSFKALNARGFDTTKGSRVFWKSNSGWETNLRWDLARDQIMYYYDLESAKADNATALDALQEFMYGIAGGGEEPRSAYLFDRLDLPNVINYMAAQTLILNQDRCTKNFDVYLDPSTNRWSILSWDIESGFGIDRGLNGTIATDYCILACEQWNSPLYCDKDHPQDMYLMTATGLTGSSPPPPLLSSASNNPYLSYAASPVATVTAPGSQAIPGQAGRRRLAAAGGHASSSSSDVYDPVAIGTSLARSRRSRKLAQANAGTFDLGGSAIAQLVSRINGGAPSPTSGEAPEAAAATPASPASLASPAAAPSSGTGTSPAATASPTDASAQDIETNFDEDLTKLGGTKLDSASSYNWLLDAVLSYPRTRAMYMRRLRTLMDQFTNGVLEERVNYWCDLVREEAIRDNEVWGSTGNPDYGRQSLLTEQLPIRKQQLYETYGPNGPDPLIPGPDPGAGSLSIGEVSQNSGGIVEIVNGGTEAVDLSGYSISGVVAMTFPPGTVLPGGDALYAVGKVSEFLADNGAKRLFAVGNLVSSNGGDLSLLDASGNTVSSA